MFPKRGNLVPPHLSIRRYDKPESRRIIRICIGALTVNLSLARPSRTCDSRGTEGNTIVKKRKPKKTSRLHRDRRRKHRHWQVTVYYHDGEKFARVYIDRERASRFADRQKKSPVVKSTRIMEVD